VIRVRCSERTVTTVGGDRCEEEAVEGLHHCRRHCLERLALERERETFGLERLKQRACQLVELELQVDELKAAQQKDRSVVLCVRKQIAEFVRRGVE